MIKFSNEARKHPSWSVANLRIQYRLTQKPFQIMDSQDAAQLLYRSWDLELINVQEHIGAIYLNARDEALAYRLISSGKLNTCTMDIGLLLTCGLLVRAKSIILCHNHPSGDPTPSKTDIRCTLQLVKAAELVGLEIYDHIILVNDGYHSMADSRNFVPSRWMRK